MRTPNTHTHTLLHPFLTSESTAIPSCNQDGGQLLKHAYLIILTMRPDDSAADLLLLQATFRNTEICAPLQMRDGDCRRHVI